MPTKLEAGDKAPDFKTVDQDNKPVSLKELLKKGRLVLYFYPKDSTPGCTTEACDFRDRAEALSASGTNVAGVSPDSAASHRKFIDKFDLPFPLLVDADHQIAEAYGAWGEKKNYGKVYEGLIRSTFVIEPSGKIAQAMYNVKATGHAERVAKGLA